MPTDKNNHTTAPIVKIDREDARFVASYGVVDTMEEGYNLAAMDWEDFEHLIREVFEKEFSSSGGEVKVTTAHYGPDAYEFAKGKPLALLDGNNLLHLLEKHGHKARIDLQEARNK
jgi:hypothetical protein